MAIGYNITKGNIFVRRNGMELEKIEYTEADVKKMAVNAYQMRELCRAKDVMAFNSVYNNCSDLEKVSPECARELKEKAKKQQLKYAQTKDPNCFAQLISDIEELYGRAFKLMIENLKSASKSSASKSEHRVSSPVREASYGVLENSSYGRETLNSTDKIATQPEKVEKQEAQEKKKGLFDRSKPKSSVEKVSLSELQEVQSELDNANTNSMTESEKEKMEAYNKSIEARVKEKQKSSSMSSTMSMGRQRSKN